MKTEMRMLDNGNYESVVLPIQHECRDYVQSAYCIQYSRKMNKLILKVGDGYCCEDHGGCEHEIEVLFCPFCGHQPERLTPEAPKGDMIV
jgi:hypothetical protein